MCCISYHFSYHVACSVLRTCGVLLCVVNTLSGQCVVLSTCIVILTCHVLQRIVDVICNECLIHISQSLIALEQKTLRGVVYC